MYLDSKNGNAAFGRGVGGVLIRVISLPLSLQEEAFNFKNVM